MSKFLSAALGPIATMALALSALAAQAQVQAPPTSPSSQASMPPASEAVIAVPVAPVDLEALMRPDPELASVVFLTGHVWGSGDKWRMQLWVDGKLVVEMAQNEAVRLDLMPHAKYKLVFQNTFAMDHSGRTATTLNTVKPGQMSGWALSSPVIFGHKPDLDPLTISEMRRQVVTEKRFRFVTPKMDMADIALAPTSYPSRIRSCLDQASPAPCEALLKDLPERVQPPAVKAHWASLVQAEQAREQAREAREAALPVTVRRDKYMVALSGYLKAERYADALTVLPKLDALAVDKDPSLNFFYGEALLKTGRKQEAAERLYRYVSEQGSGAAHYAQALALINEAEAQP